MKVKFEVKAKNYFVPTWIGSLDHPETVVLTTEYNFDDEDIFDLICKEVRTKGVKDTVIHYRTLALVPHMARTIQMDFYVMLTLTGNVYAVWKDDDLDSKVDSEHLVLWFDGSRNSLSQFGFFELLGASPVHVPGAPNDTFEMRLYEHPSTRIEPDLEQVGVPIVLKTTEPKWYWYENEMLYLIRLHKELETSYPNMNDSQKAMSTSPEALVKNIWRKVVDYIAALDITELTSVAEGSVPNGIMCKVGFLVRLGMDLSEPRDLAVVILQHKKDFEDLIEMLKD